MIVACTKCNTHYDDTFRRTFCPHAAFPANDGKNNFAYHIESFIFPATHTIFLTAEEQSVIIRALKLDQECDGYILETDSIIRQHREYTRKSVMSKLNHRGA